MAGAIKGNAKKTVTAGGTAERLTTTPLNCCAITIQALPTNTGRVAIGTSSGVKQDLSGGDLIHVLGVPSGASIPSFSFGTSLKSYVFDASEIWIDASTGEGVLWGTVNP